MLALLLAAVVVVAAVAEKVIDNVVTCSYGCGCSFGSGSDDDWPLTEIL